MELQLKRAGVELGDQAYHDDTHCKGRTSYRSEHYPTSKTTNRNDV